MVNSKYRRSIGDGIPREQVYFRVKTTCADIPEDNLSYGFEDYFDFLAAVKGLIKRFGGRVGERVRRGEVYDRLRFDNEIGEPEEAWIYHFLLVKTPPPSASPQDDSDEDCLAGVFGEGW